MQQVHDGISLIAIRGIARRQINEHVAIRRVAFQVSFERPSMHLNVFDSSFLRRRAGLREYESERHNKIETHSLSSRKQFKKFTPAARNAERPARPRRRRGPALGL